MKFVFPNGDKSQKKIPLQQEVLHSKSRNSRQGVFLKHKIKNTVLISLQTYRWVQCSRCRTIQTRPTNRGGRYSEFMHTVIKASMCLCTCTYRQSDAVWRSDIRIKRMPHKIRCQ